MATRNLQVVIAGDASGAQNAFRQVEGSGVSMGEKLSGVGKKLTMGLTLPLVAGGAVAFKYAGDLAETMSKARVVFGDNSKDILNWSKTSATAMGMSRDQALGAASSLGMVFTQVGMNATEAGKMSKSWVTLAADLASFNNASPEEVLTAITAATRGEYDALQQYVPMINAATVEQKAMAMGLADANGEISAQAKVQAINQLMFEQTTKAQGDFGRTAGGAANQQKILTAKMKDTAAQIGGTLLPIGTKLLGWASNLSGAFGGLTKTQQTLVLGFAGFAAALGPVLSFTGNIMKLAKVLKLATAAQWLWNVAMSANPIMLIVIGVAALVAAVVLAYQKVGWFRDFVDGAFNVIKTVISTVFNWVKDNWPLLLTILTGPIGLAVLLIKTHWNTIIGVVSGVINWIRSNWQTLLAIITGPIGVAVYIIHRYWGSITSGASWAVNSIIGVFRGLAGGIGSAVSGVYNAIIWPFQTAINAVRSLWNNTIGGRSFSIGGGSFFGVKIPKLDLNIPRLHTGGVFQAADGGAGLALLRDGERVLTPTQQMPISSSAAAQPTPQPIFLNITIEGNVTSERDLFESLRQYLVRLSKTNPNVLSGMSGAGT